MKCYDMQTYARNPDGLNEISPTVLSHWGTGGQRRVHVLALDGDKGKFRPKDNYERAGGNGFGLSDGETMYTLNTVDRHIVAVIGD